MIYGQLICVDAVLAPKPCGPDFSGRERPDMYGGSVDQHNSSHHIASHVQIARLI